MLLYLIFIFSSKNLIKPTKYQRLMAKDNKIRLPSGQGGLTRYFDEYKSKIEFSPAGVIVLAIIVMIIIIFLHYFGGQFFQ